MVGGFGGFGSGFGFNAALNPWQFPSIDSVRDDISAVYEINAKSDCYDENNIDPIWGFMYAGGNLGATLGFVRKDPATGLSIGLSGSYLGGKNLSIMGTIGGMGIGGIYNNGSIMPAIGYHGIYFYGNGASIGIFSFGAEGLQIAPFYVPLIMGLVNTIPMMAQNSNALEDMEDPGWFFMRNYLINTLNAVFPFFKDILAGSTDISKIPPLRTKRGAMAAMALLTKLREDGQFDHGMVIARKLYFASSDASPVIRAELLNQYDLFLQARNASDIPSGGIKEGIGYALNAMQAFHKRYKAWLSGEKGDIPSETEVREYMTASLLASEKLQLLLRRKRNSKCLKIESSAAVDFSGLEMEYLETMSEFSRYLERSSSGIWRFIGNKQDELAGRFISAIDPETPSSDAADLKVELDSYAEWVTRVAALMNDGGNRFNYLKWKARDDREELRPADAKKISTAYRAASSGKRFQDYLELKQVYDIFESVYYYTYTDNTDNRSAIFAAVYSLEELGDSITTKSGQAIYTEIRKRCYELLRERTGYKLHWSRKELFENRFFPEYERQTRRLKKIRDALRADDPVLRRVDIEIQELQTICEMTKKRLFDDKGNVSSDNYGNPRRKRHGQSGLKHRDITYDCRTFREELQRTDMEIHTVVGHIDAITNIIRNEGSLSESKKVKYLRMLGDYFETYARFIEKRKALTEAAALRDQGGNICSE